MNNNPTTSRTKVTLGFYNEFGYELVDEGARVIARIPEMFIHDNSLFYEDTSESYEIGINVITSTLIALLDAAWIVNPPELRKVVARLSEPGPPYTDDDVTLTILRKGV